MKEKQFSGKVALVTGAATGIGAAIAKAFALEGAKVVVNTRSNVKAGTAVMESIKALGGEATFIQGDISKEADVERLISECVRIYGRLDCAVNNAGVGPDGARIPIEYLENYTEELWDSIVDINLKGSMFCMKHEIRQMLKQGGGSIVNISSISAQNTSLGFAGYNASKAGLNKLTQVAAAECATRNIRLNTIMPGPIQTPLLDNLLETDPTAAEMFARRVPMRRIGQPEEIASVALWLCSDGASFVTGHAVPVEGGMSIWVNE